MFACDTPSCVRAMIAFAIAETLYTTVACNCCCCCFTLLKQSQLSQRAIDLSVTCRSTVHTTQQQHNTHAPTAYTSTYVFFFFVCMCVVGYPHAYWNSISRQQCIPIQRIYASHSVTTPLLLAMLRLELSLLSLQLPVACCQSSIGVFFFCCVCFFVKFLLLLLISLRCVLRQNAANAIYCMFSIYCACICVLYLCCCGYFYYAHCYRCCCYCCRNCGLHHRGVTCGLRTLSTNCFFFRLIHSMPLVLDFICDHLVCLYVSISPCLFVRLLSALLYT